MKKKIVTFFYQNLLSLVSQIYKEIKQVRPRSKPNSHNFCQLLVIAQNSYASKVILVKFYVMSKV